MASLRFSKWLSILNPNLGKALLAAKDRGDVQAALEELRKLLPRAPSNPGLESDCLRPDKHRIWEDIAGMDSYGQLWTAMDGYGCVAEICILQNFQTWLHKACCRPKQTSCNANNSERMSALYIMSAQAEHATVNDLWKSRWVANHKNCYSKLMNNAIWLKHI